MDPQHVIIFKGKSVRSTFMSFLSASSPRYFGRVRATGLHGVTSACPWCTNTRSAVSFFLLETCTHKQFQDIKCGRNEGDGATQTPSVSMTPACLQMLLWREAYIENRMEYLNVCATFQSILQMFKIIPVQTKSIFLKQP